MIRFGEGFWRDRETGRRLEWLETDVRPLVAFRGYHALAHERGDFRTEVEKAAGRLTLKPSAELPALAFAHETEGVIVHEGAWWYRRFQYQRERERGFDFEEDLFSPFSLELDLSMRTEASLVVSTNGRPVSDAPALAEQESIRRERIAGPKTDRGALRAIRRAAD